MDGSLRDLSSSVAWNVASHLETQAAQQPDELAVAVAQKHGGFEELSCLELNRRCDAYAWALEDAGICAGVRTVLMVPPSPEFFALTFALFKIGAVPVFVDPGMGIPNLRACLDEAQPHAFIGVPKAHAARIALGWAKQSLRIWIHVGLKLGRGQRLDRIMRSDSVDKSYPTKSVEPDELAGILFTSGSTGLPKGAEYTHGMFTAQVEMIRSGFGIEPGERDLSTFPLFALFGPALGMASIAPDMDFTRPGRADPRNLLAAVERYQCTNAFASPAIVEKLGRYFASHPTKLPSLKRVISAGAPAVPAALQRFLPALSEGVEIYTPYGATEAMPLTRIGSAEVLAETAAASQKGSGVCVGEPLPGVSFRIIKITDEAIARIAEISEADPAPAGFPYGAVGEIVVRAPVASAKYWARTESTRLAKIVDDDGVLLHRMGDVGYLDQRGRLWMCGRKAHRVDTENGRRYFSVPCEAVFNSIPNIRRTALVGVGRQGAQVPVICVELERGVQKRQRNALLSALMERARSHKHTEGIDRFLFHPEFPVDVRHNAKIFREELARWASKQIN